MGQQKPQPYSTFGKVLHDRRVKLNKSTAEVSGAVEVDIKLLESYERGEIRPSEDILLLLISHFSLQDEEADEWLRLAGYNTLNDDAYFINDDYGIPKQIQTAIQQVDDTKIVYTDMIQVMVNNYGVILSFLQGASVGNQPLAVARVGMSKEHAKSVLEVLKRTMEQAETTPESKPVKQLPAKNKKQA